MLRKRIYLALVGLVMVIILGAAFAFWSADTALREAKRSQTADATLEGFFELSTLLERLLHSISHASLSEALPLAPAKEIHQAVIAKIAMLRERVVAETGALGGAGELKSEINELAVLASIESRVRELDSLIQLVEKSPDDVRANWSRMHDFIDGTFESEIRKKLDGLIADEREQALKADAHKNRTLTGFRLIAVLYACFAIVTIACLGHYLARRIRTPFDALLHATNTLAKGDLNARVYVPYADEFESIANNVNAIAVDRMERRAELLAQREKLEQVVQARTDELRVAMERVRAADDLRRQLFADISHELRTPLTAIRGEAEIALRGPEKSAADFRSTLERIISISAQLARLIDDLLFISRTDNGLHRMNMTTVRLRQLLASACQDGRALAFERSRDAEISLVEADREIAVFGDPDRLHQLFLILIDNAIRYSPDKIRIDVRLNVQDQLVTVSLTDRGAGIPTAEIPQLLMRYQRGRSTDGDAGDGLGLGLPIAKAIVDAHGGNIEISSELGVGTTVTVALRIARPLRSVA